MMTEKIVLIVDDEPEIRELIAENVAKFGYKTIEANDGSEALRLLYDTGIFPQLITTDIEMHPMDGVTFLTLLRAQPDYKSTPVLVISSDQRIRRLNGVERLEKPFSIQSLLSSLASFISK